MGGCICLFVARALFSVEKIFFVVGGKNMSSSSLKDSSHSTHVLI